MTSTERPSLSQYLNGRDAADLAEQLHRCCGSARWVEQMSNARPFRDDAAVFEVAETVWRSLGVTSWLEAATHHPRIGERNVTGWAQGEQAGMSTASNATQDALVEENQRYEERFGFVFLICATGLSAEVMLTAIHERLQHDRDTELRIMAEEQLKICRLRLEKLVTA